MFEIQHLILPDFALAYKMHVQWKQNKLSIGPAVLVIARKILRTDFNFSYTTSFRGGGGT